MIKYVPVPFLRSWDKEHALVTCMMMSEYSLQDRENASALGKSNKYLQLLYWIGFLKGAPVSNVNGVA